MTQQHANEMSTVPTIDGYFEENLAVGLTRREVYYLRGILKKKIASARQGMNEPKAGPQKRRARYEEFVFLRCIQDKLYGSDPDEADERGAACVELKRQAEEMEARAAEMRELAASM